MRNVLIPIIAAALLLISGIFILNAQLWYSLRSERLAGAHYAARNIATMLDEAQEASGVADEVIAKGCDAQGQYQLGTEAALQPHLRTLLIFNDGRVWCSSLPGNHVLLLHVAQIPEKSLLLLSKANTVDDRPVLLFQRRYTGKRIIITVSDRHIRDVLNTPLRDANYSLVVDNQVMGLYGDIYPQPGNLPGHSMVSAERYPFGIQYNLPVLFSAGRLIHQGGGILIFLLLLSGVAAYALYKYLNKSTTPEETLRGVEVLARWKHPKAGFISPSVFIPAAEKSGLIVPLTRSLMAQVVAHMNAIESKLPEGFHIGINFSASHIIDSGFVAECLAYKQNFSRQDLNLVIEVTEREPLHVDEHLIQTLNMLHENGFAIALDDFGTGYSGLSYLHDLHIDYIKIDQSFVGRVNAYEDSTLILDSVLELARKLSISIVAEGVETQAQLDYLSRNNITYLQGFYFFKPVSLPELVKILLSKPKVRVVVE
ncbi:EAL domain-containing protein [Kluyvera sp. EC_51]|uniref:EAL domain-containing protein n=1 Tax=Kluyvera sp. EC_51 TaxID=2584089 RepID=UPI001C700EB1|nr:cyclic diguanylate phosphodiesterase [Kluyvera sp. EC_51]MBW9463374.1 EAL domain-containing protein [Kluyvera sp. EC_51]